MPTARCAECEWTAESKTVRMARALLEQHHATEHQAVAF